VECGDGFAGCGKCKGWGFTDVQNYVKNVEKYGAEVEIMFKKW
jgi:hypothetical protein